MTSVATELNKIADQLRPLAVSLDALVLDPANARTHGEDSLKAIRQSLATFGQTKPIVIDDRMTVVAGNGTVMAARQLGWTEIAASRFTGDETARRAYAIADNRTAELSTWDEPALELALGVLASTDDTLLLAAGFSDNERAELAVRVADQVAAQAAREANGGPGAPIPSPTYTIVFESAKHKAIWDAFLAALKPAYPELPEAGSRLVQFLTDRKAQAMEAAEDAALLEAKADESGDLPGW